MSIYFPFLLCLEAYSKALGTCLINHTEILCGSYLILQNIYASSQGIGARSWQLRTVVKGSKPLCLKFPKTYRMLVHSMVIPNWVRLTGFASPQVDGEMRQKGSTKDMIFKIPFLISHISSIMTLLEGDVILTGTAYLLFLVQLLKWKYLTTTKP